MYSTSTCVYSQYCFNHMQAQRNVLDVHVCGFVFNTSKGFELLTNTCTVHGRASDYIHVVIGRPRFNP